MPSQESKRSYEKSARKVFIRTFGCQMNVYDSGKLAERLVAAGWEVTSNPSDAKLWVVNSCSVREKAEHKAISELGRLASIKRKKGFGILALVGCVAQQHGSLIFEHQPDCDLVVGTRAYARFIDLVSGAESGEKVADIGDESELGIEGLHPKPLFWDGKVSAFVPIMRGCNNFCSYCIVPFVRASEVSRAPDEVIEEIEALVALGVKEVMLLGQNVNSYGLGTDHGDFADLLERLCAIDGLLRIRFTTSHPKDFSDKLLDSMAENAKVSKHLHLPFQSGSNKILELMNRGYTREKYLSMVTKAREKIPELALSADVMVGFCTESEDDFMQSLDLIKTVKFDGLFTFRYTPRPLSRAHNLPDDVPEREKIRRLQIIHSAQNEIQLEKNRELVGKTVEVLVEGCDLKHSGWLSGRTGQNRLVHFIPSSAKARDVVRVRVERAAIHHLEGVEVACGFNGEDFKSKAVG